MARLIDQLIGNHYLGKQLLHLAQENQLPHALLLSGESGLGKTQWAWAIIQELSCSSPTSQGACGECYSCRSIEHKNSPFVLSITPQGESIKLEQAQEIHHFFAHQRIYRLRAVIIEQAHKMLPSTANKLLKILEEPPQDSFFFLISAYPWQLLPTIRSRLSEWRLQPVSEEVLRSHFPQAPGHYLQVARGRPGILKKIMAWQNCDKDPRHLAWELLLLKTRGHIQDLEGLNQYLSDPELIEGVLFWGYQLLRDLHFARHNWWEQVISRDLINEASFSCFLSRDLVRWSEQWLKLEQKLGQNRDQLLAVQEFVLSDSQSVIAF